MHLPLLPTVCYAGIAAALMLATVAINASDWPDPVPQTGAPPNPAVRERIRAFESGTSRQVIGIVRMERADGRAFYLIDAPCCDQVNPLYDVDGRHICGPTGGFAGTGDGKCPLWVRELRWSMPLYLRGPAKPPALQGY